MRKLITLLLTIMMMFSIVSVVSADDEASSTDEIKFSLEEGEYDHNISVTVTWPENNDGGETNPGGGWYVYQIQINDEMPTGAGVPDNVHTFDLEGKAGETTTIVLTAYNGGSSENESVSKTYKITLPESSDTYTPEFKVNGTKGEDGAYTSDVSVEWTNFPDSGGWMCSVTGTVDDGTTFKYSSGSGNNYLIKSYHTFWLYGICGHKVNFKVDITPMDENTTRTYELEYSVTIKDDSDALFELSNGYKLTNTLGADSINPSITHSDPIKLLKDISKDDYNRYTDIMHNIFDLNGHTLEIANFGDYTSGTFRIISSTGTGSITFEDDNKTIIFNGDVSKYIPNGYKTYMDDPGDKYNGPYYKLIKEGSSVSVDTSTPAIDNTVANNVSNVTDAQEGFNMGKIEKVDPTLEEAKPTDTQKQTIETKAKELVSDGKVSKYLDLTIKATDTDDNTATITELSESADITILLDDATNDLIKNSDISKLKVIRLHDDKAEEVKASYNEGSKTLTITSDKFSIYAIVTAEKKQNNNNNTTNNNQGTSSSNNTQSTTRTEANTPCEEWYGSKNWTWSAKANACVYRVTNTSSK